MNTAAVESPSLVREVADDAGCQAVVVWMDVKRNFLEKYVRVSRSVAWRVDQLAHIKGIEAIHFVYMIRQNSPMDSITIN